MSIASPSRTVRRDPGNARLTARDLTLLRFIAHAQPITSRHAQIVLGTSMAMTRRRLRALRDLGAVRVWVESMESASWYTLGDAARPELQRVFGMEPEDIHTPRGIGRTNLVHHGGIVTCYAQILSACSSAQRVRLVRFLMEAEIRKQIGIHTADVLVPDAVALLDLAGELFALVLEVDTGTERNPGWLAGKFAAYAEQWATSVPVAGTTSWVVGVVVLSGDRRLHRLALAAAERGVEDGVIFATSEVLSEATFLRAVWKAPRLSPDGEQVTLITTGPLPAVISNRDLGDHRFPAKNAAFTADHRLERSQPFASEDA